MKEKLTLRNLVVAVAFLLGIIALIVSFGAGAKQVITEQGISVTTEVKGLIFGKNKTIVAGLEVASPAETQIHAKLSQLGVILLVVAPAIALVAALFLPADKAKKVVIAAAVVALVGVVFVCMMKGSYARQEVKTAVKEYEKQGYNVTAEMKSKMLAEIKESMKDSKANGALVVTIVLGILEVLGLGAFAFLPEKK